MRFRSMALCLGLLVAGSSGASAQDVALTGRTVDEHGRPLAGVSIELTAGKARAQSDASGRFTIRDAGAGVVRVRARRLGYAPLDTLIAVGAGAPAVVLRLRASALHLSAVEVRERVDPSDARLAGFRDRAAARAHGGRFITRAQLDARINTRIVDLLREVPGVEVRGPTRHADRSIRLRGANCPPLVFVDGAPASAGEFELELLDIGSLEGLEIYPGLASVPAQFQAARSLHRCGVIAAWSRAPRLRAAVQRAELPERVSALVDRGEVYAGSDVDEMAILITETSPEPIYPESLWAQAVAGEVIIEAIVDTAGRVESEHLNIVSSTHPLFGAAAVAALRESTFRPAVRNRRRVRQVVHVPYSFIPGSSRNSRGPQEIP